MKVGDLVKHRDYNRGSIDPYGVGIVFSFSRSGDLAKVLWTKANIVWSFIKNLEIINES